MKYGKTLKYWWTFELRVEFLIISELMKYGWTFDQWVNFLIMGNIAYMDEIGILLMWNWVCVYLSKHDYSWDYNMNYTESINSKYSNFFMFSLHLFQADFISCIVPFTNLFMSPLISGFTTEHRNTWALSMIFPQLELHDFGSPLFDGSGFVILY